MILGVPLSPIVPLGSDSEEVFFGLPPLRLAASISSAFYKGQSTISIIQATINTSYVRSILALLQVYNRLTASGTRRRLGLKIGDCKPSFE